MIFSFWITKEISKKEKLAEIVFKQVSGLVHLELIIITKEIVCGLLWCQNKGRRPKLVAKDVAGMTYKHGEIP
jgi:hypothetical protein